MPPSLPKALDAKRSEVAATQERLAEIAGRREEAQQAVSDAQSQVRRFLAARELGEKVGARDLDAARAALQEAEGREEAVAAAEEELQARLAAGEVALHDLTFREAKACVDASQATVMATAAEIRGLGEKISALLQDLGQELERLRQAGINYASAGGGRLDIPDLGESVFASMNATIHDFQAHWGAFTSAWIHIWINRR